ncbi:MAG: tRNA modification GTPase MnmE [Candidatus Poribacteria bacterium]|nr:MAG: tRNA modification GTPase MnmE [Candidatus Poribacteria bacterium]
MRLRDDRDTIAAIATPRGVGAIGIVRVSGDRALEIARRLFRPSRGGEYRPRGSHRLQHGFLIDPQDGSPVDEVLIAYFRAPRTYTGEEMIEIYGHGGPYVLSRILELVCRSGARPAEPGEFTKRAFLNGRIDLSQAEAVADLIHAQTEAGLRAATAQLRGRLSARIRQLREQLIAVLAEVEAQIDFPDEDLDFQPPERLLEELDRVEGELLQLLEEAERGRIVRDGLRLAIVGKPNVGKSSLLNALLNEERAIVTEIPGTTRDVIEEVLDLRGVPVRVADTAGIRQASDPVEQEGVRRSQERIEQADLVLVVLDTSRPLDADDAAVFKHTQGRRRIFVLNKSDLPARWGAEALAPWRAPEEPWVRLSLIGHPDLSPLVEAIVETAVGDASLGAEPPLITNLRHRQALEEALQALRYAQTSLREGAPPELVAVDLRGALSAVGEIVGETTPDEVLDRIFSTFCIGK